MHSERCSLGEMVTTGTHRQCVTCDELLPVEEFPWADRARGFRRRSCRPCFARNRVVARKKYTDGYRDEINEKARGYHYANRERVNAARTQRHHELSPVEKHRRRATRMYGISSEQYDEMMLRQKGVCAICGKPESVTRKGRVRALTVDHDHVTGRVRGLLCSLCNLALGCVRDDAKVLRSASAYLEMKEAL